MFEYEQEASTHTHTLYMLVYRMKKHIRLWFLCSHMCVCVCGSFRRTLFALFCLKYFVPFIHTIQSQRIITSPSLSYRVRPPEMVRLHHYGWWKYGRRCERRSSGKRARAIWVMGGDVPSGHTTYSGGVCFVLGM